MPHYRNAASVPRDQLVPAARARLLGIAEDLERVLPPRELIGLVMGVGFRVLAKHMPLDQQAGYLRDVAAHLERKELEEAELADRLKL